MNFATSGATMPTTISPVESLLNDLFSANFEVGNTSEYTIWVNVLKHNRTGTSNGFNYGIRNRSS
jgi:hypothetical protein